MLGLIYLKSPSPQIEDKDILPDSVPYTGFAKIGGIDGLAEQYKKAVPEVRNPNSTCGYPREDAFNIFRDPVSSDNPWPGLLLQASLGCFWYWCADQVCIKVYAGKNR